MLRNPEPYPEHLRQVGKGGFRAELTIVPAMKARDIGLDRTLIGAYGHDDRVCAYPMMLATIEAENPVHTLYAIFADKEETGSDGPTGMQGSLMTDVFADLANTMGANINTVRANSKCLSADVNAAFDPKFGGQFEARNSSYINRGVVVTKYTGGGGKGGTNDASARVRLSLLRYRRVCGDAGRLWILFSRERQGRSAPCAWGRKITGSSHKAIVPQNEEITQSSFLMYLKHFRFPEYFSIDMVVICIHDLRNVPSNFLTESQKYDILSVYNRMIRYKERNNII